MVNEDLKLLYIDTRDITSFGIADVSCYPDNYNVVNPTLEITPPGYPTRNVGMYAKSANIYYADDLGVGDSNTVSLPDGIYTVKFTIGSMQNLSIQKSFLRIELLKCKYYNVFESIDLQCNCNKETIRVEKEKLRKAKLLIEGAVAAANKQDFTSAYQLYKKAEYILTKLINCNCK